MYAPDFLLTNALVFEIIQSRRLIYPLSRTANMANLHHMIFQWAFSSRRTSPASENLLTYLPALWHNFITALQTWATLGSPSPKNPGSLTILQHLSGARRKAEVQMSERLVLWEQASWPLHRAAQLVN